MTEDDERYTEGVCDDGAAILDEGRMMPIEEVLATLNCHAVEVERLEEALEPFAVAAEDIPLIEDDQENVLQHPLALNITFGHLRTAHAVFNKDRKL